MAKDKRKYAASLSNQGRKQGELLETLTLRRGQSAAKPSAFKKVWEGSETIPKGSTVLFNRIGSALLQYVRMLDDDIVHPFWKH